MEFNLKVKENLHPVGKITVRSHPAGSIEIFEELIKAGEIEKYKQLLSLGKIESQNHNRIMSGTNTGKNIIIQWLLGVNTFPIGINYIAIGTSNAAPADADTILGSESARTIISFSEPSGNNEAIIQGFITDANLPNNTYYEVGGFINGNGSTNSGQLFNHSLLGSPYIKTSGTDTTLEIDITLT